MKKHIFILLAFIVSAIPMFGQIEADMPNWVKKLPKSNPDHHYYYRVTIGQGETYDKAYANAFAKALLESSWKLGVRVRTTDDVNALENSITQSISVDDHTMNIPINKVCDYWEEFYSPRMIRLYVLWQVAIDALKTPVFDEFLDCE